MVTRALVLAAVLLAVVACRESSERAPAPAQPSAAVAAAAVESSPGICPLTLADGHTPSTENQTGANHGNGKLWTTLWPHNIVVAVDDYGERDGGIGMKWPWWRGVRGQVRVSGRRLDASAPPLTADVPTGYGSIGFQPSGIHFPTEGCWEVTGHVGAAELTFVTLVVKASRYYGFGEN